MASSEATSQGVWGLRLVAGLLFCSVIGAAVAFWQFQRSERYVADALQDMRREGKLLSVEQCVDRVVDRSGRCEAMLSICESTSPRLMHACLEARDRTAYCGTLTTSTADTRFGFKACTARGARKGLPKKACASAYRTIDAYCREIAESSRSLSRSSTLRRN